MRFFLAAGLLVSVTGGAPAQSSGLAEARQQMADAAIKGDKASYARFLTDDATWIDRAGRLRNKTAMLADVQPQSPTPPSASDVRAYGNSAVVVSKRRNPDGVEVAVIQAWVKNGNQWQLVGHGAIPATVKNVGSPATKPSSPLPANVGTPADRDAVQKNSDAVSAAFGKGDAAAFENAVTSQFVMLQPDSDPVTKEVRAQQIRTSGPGRVVKPLEASIRIHGNMAVIVERLAASAQDPNGSSAWRMIVAVKEDGAWKRAATVTTPITGAARPVTH